VTRTNTLKATLASGGTVFGTWSMLSSPAVANVVGESGVDFIIVDLEHGPTSFETAEAELYAAEAGGTTPIIRLGESTEPTILRALETGTQALLVSHVGSATEAVRVVEAAKYPPEGTRGLSPFTRHHGYSADDLGAKLQRANDELFLGALVEGPNALGELEAIAATPGLDMVYLGIYDLSATVGVPGELKHPLVLDAVRDCVGRIEAHGKVAGSVAPDPEYLEILVDAGFRFLSYSVDSAILRSGLEAARRKYEELVGG
jgi:2-keto-3-deoxy-L-rhamnonate aldolase RhmA